MRRQVFGIALGLAVSLLASREAAQAAIFLANPAAVVGQWDMILANSNRRCRMTMLNLDAGSRGIGMPAGCRRSLPILSTVGAWSLVSDNRLDLDDSSGSPVLTFVTAAGNQLVASGPEGETYRLVAVTAQALQPDAGGFQPVEAGRNPGFESVKIAATTSPVATARADEVAGRYAILRDGGKDTGCMLTLDDKTRVKGGNRATLAPACRDQGIVIFDPVAWALSSGHLVLTARKGHATHLEHLPNGTWEKDAKEGKPLGLKKM